MLNIIISDRKCNKVMMNKICIIKTHISTSATWKDRSTRTEQLKGFTHASTFVKRPRAWGFSHYFGTSMYHGFEVHFQVYRWMDNCLRPMCINGKKKLMFVWKFVLKSTQFEQNLAFCWKWNSEGCKTASF